LAFANTLLAAPARAQQAPAAPPPVTTELAARYIGAWSGHLRRAGQETPIAIHLDAVGQRGGGTVSWPDLGHLDAPILGTSLQPNDEVRISLPLPMGSLRLVGGSDGEVIAGRLEEIGRIDGAFASRGIDGTFELRRTGPVQHPYAIQSLRFRSSDGTLLAGSAYLPLGSGPFSAVVYVHGSGDSARSDGAFLADMLAKNGIAAFVYDKRGVGESQGQWRDSSMEMLAEDAHAALKTVAAHPAIDGAKIGYVGRSQGGWIVPMALRKGGAAFAAFISGAAVSTIDEDLDHYRQLFSQSGRPAGDYEAAETLMRQRYSAMRGHVSRARLVRLAKRAENQPWFKLLEWADLDKNETPFDRAWIGYEPAQDLEAISVPTYWLYGSADYVIPVGASIANVVTHVRKSPPTIEVLPGADHALASGAYPALPAGVGSATRRITDWISATLGLRDAR
jgi:pimeloyl-ACP methyl ester carboxylesterase